MEHVHILARIVKAKDLFTKMGGLTIYCVVINKQQPAILQVRLEYNDNKE